MQLLIAQNSVSGDERYPFQNISELPNISRPGIALQRSQCDPTKFQVACSKVGSQLAKDMGTQNGYVFYSFTQRWNGERNPGDAIVQIAPKWFAQHWWGQGLLGGCNQTNVNSSITNLSLPAKLFLIHDFQ